MKYQVKVTVIDKKLYPELQEAYCTDPQSGACPCYNVGDEFIFRRDEVCDSFWQMGLNTLVKTSADPKTVECCLALPVAVKKLVYVFIVHSCHISGIVV